ncbi:MAG: sugar phosphate nucleotidyltransferase [bacterium]|nr:sugar phosphate nucleotidyltransferase [bacterium]
MQEKGTIGIILGARQVPDELVPVFGAVPATLIPINGKPVIFFLLEHFRSLGIRQVYVSVGYQREKVEAILNVYSDEDSFRVIPVAVDPQKRPGSALLDIIKSIPQSERKTNGLYIQLADTLLPSSSNLRLERNFIVVSNEYAQSEYWCVVDRDPNDKKITAIYDKQKGKEGKFAAVGAYHFIDGTLWDDMEEQNCEISSLLEHVMSKGQAIEAREESEWFDLGHLEKYYQAKARLLSSRAFNELRTGEFMNTVVKRSSRNEILKDEILWYVNLPKELKIYAPRIIDYNVDESKGEVYAEFEFYGYPSLANLWLYGDFSLVVWQTMIDRVFAILQQFRRNPYPVKFEDSLAMYAGKTELRIKQAKEQSKMLAGLFEAESVQINGEKYKGWPSFQGHLEEFAKQLYAEEDHCFLHGDMCFSNILFDLNYGVVKLVDPRGKWGSESFYGDIKYDVAKLRHSSAGFYDHIVQGHVNVSYSNAKEPSITLDFPLVNDLHRAVQGYVDRKISETWDLKKIKLIEGLLFVSMIPLHSENEKRQIAMFAQGIRLLNEVAQ